ncbi:MAG: B12-binding domain-containing radical SAM protein [Acidobacteria bacterium]|nr:B12-binding domain-containing radical SAM protein [Acidobacteriota bacterium]
MKPKVLLFFPSYRSIEAVPPLSLLALAPVLERQGYRIEIVDSTVEPKYKERILGQLDESVCLGISIVTGPMIEEAVEVATAVKAKRPHFPVVLGGWHPSSLADQCLKAPYVDIVVRGQGELTLSEIVPRLESGKDVAGIAGCSFKTPDGRIVHNPPRPTTWIRRLPTPSYHLVDLEPYARLSQKRWIAYTSSHGCPYDCSFCSNASLYGRAWNALPAERVVSEVTELVQKFRLSLVDIMDDNFLVDRQRGVEIARGFVQSGLRFNWIIQTTANFILRLSDEELRLMRQGGLSTVFIGAESGSDDVLLGANKVRFQGTRVVREVAEKLYHAGITATFSLIFGLPGETERDRQLTLKMVFDLKQRFPTTEFHSNIYTPYPGAPNFRQAVAMGLREPQSLEEWAAFYPKFQRLPWLDNATHERIQRIREYIRIGFGAAPIRRRSLPRAIAIRLFAPAARFRLRSDRYSVPMELWCLKFMSRARAALGLSVRTHVVRP